MNWRTSASDISTFQCCSSRNAHIAISTSSQPIPVAAGGGVPTAMLLMVLETNTAGQKRAPWRQSRAWPTPLLGQIGMKPGSGCVKAAEERDEARRGGPRHQHATVARVCAPPCGTVPGSPFHARQYSQQRSAI